MEIIKSIIRFTTVLFIMILIICTASCSRTAQYMHPLEIEFNHHEMSGRDLIKYARLVDAAERLLTSEEGVPNSALDSSRKSVRLDSRTGTSTIMFRFDPSRGNDDPHAYIYIVEVHPDLSCQFKGAVEFDVAH